MTSLLVFGKNPENWSRSVLAKYNFLRLKVFRFEKKKKENILTQQHFCSYICLWTVVWNRDTWCSFFQIHSIFYLWLFRFLIALKKRTCNSHIFLSVFTTSSWSLFILKNNYIYNHIKEYTHKSENILMISFHTNDSHKKHHTLLLLCE